MALTCEADGDHHATSEMVPQPPSELSASDFMSSWSMRSAQLGFCSLPTSPATDADGVSGESAGEVSAELVVVNADGGCRR